jgi:hypothetical protein
VARLHTEVEDLKQGVTELGLTLATLQTVPVAPIRLLPTPPLSPPARPAGALVHTAAPASGSLVQVVTPTVVGTPPAVPEVHTWRPAPATKAPRPQPTPPHFSRCLFVGNFRGPDGNWYFKAGQEGWRAKLTALLGAQAMFLAGAQLVPTPRDTRLCLACPTRGARGALLARLRDIRSLRVNAQLSV